MVDRSRFAAELLTGIREKVGNSIAVEYRINASDMYEAAKDAEVLVILTEWPDFRQADMQKVRAQMKTLNIVDLRNLLNPDDMRAMGFKYQGIGR